MKKTYEIPTCMVEKLIFSDVITASAEPDIDTQVLNEKTGYMKDYL